MTTCSLGDARKMKHPGFYAGVFHFRLWLKLDINPKRKAIEHLLRQLKADQPRLR